MVGLGRQRGAVLCAQARRVICLLHLVGMPATAVLASVTCKHPLGRPVQRRPPVCDNLSETTIATPGRAMLGWCGSWREHGACASTAHRWVLAGLQLWCMAACLPASEATSLERLPEEACVLSTMPAGVQPLSIRPDLLDAPTDMPTNLACMPLRRHICRPSSPRLASRRQPSAMPRTWCGRMAHTVPFPVTSSRLFARCCCAGKDWAGRAALPVALQHRTWAAFHWMW